MSPLSSFNPLGSTVRVVDELGNVLGESRVARDPNSASSGTFTTPYDTGNSSKPVYLEFLSVNNNINVTDHAENTYVQRVNSSIIPEIEPRAVRNVVIQVGDGSGAFHIMTTLHRMIPLYLAYGGSSSNFPIRADWERGKTARGLEGPGSLFSPSTGVISIGGHVFNPDEFDDSVLLREFGRLILHQTGAVISDSGRSSFNCQISPSLAFSEGYAMYLGQKVIGDTVYRDGKFTIDLSDLPNYGIPLGTSLPNDNSDGDISEVVVASASYYLDYDFRLGVTMQASLTDPTKLLTQQNYNRLGDPTAVDFSDMVSIVVCPLTEIQSNISSQLLENQYELPWIDEVNFCE